MRRRWILASVTAAALVAGLFWVARRQGALVEASRDKSRTIVALEKQLDVVRQEFVVQREMLRNQTLTTTTRTPDEFLSLFPAKYPQGNWQPTESLFEDCWFRAADGLRLHGWLIHRERRKHVILVMHGNAGNLTHRAATARDLSDRYAASVFVFDYRGYGRSEGAPTIPGLLLDARAARALLSERERVDEEEIVLIGESLGGAIAVDLAAEDGARALIL